MSPEDREVYRRSQLKRLEAQTLAKEAEEKGIEIGIEKRNIEVAENLISLRMENEIIKKASNLSIQQIEALGKKKL